jgi:hypothetical protein
MFTKLALASALAIPLGLFSLSGTAGAVTAWTPNGDYNPKYDIPMSPEHAQPQMAIRHAAMSCAAARRIVRDDGYHNIRAETCGARIDKFDATRNGHRVVLHVDPRNGHVWQG